ncbi:response regulator [Trichothermofontia sp.]
MKILLIEDDEQIAVVLSEMLTAHHYLVEHATDGKTGLDLAQAFTYDLIVLDLAIPYLDGLSVCRKLRKQGRVTPILVLTARDSETDKAQGLDAGADDYVCKPFNALELLARIRALIRRSQALPNPSLVWERLVMHPLRGEVTYADQPLALTPKEFGLLELFLRNPQRIFSRSAILDQLWSYEKPPSESAVTMHIKDLRQKLKAAGLTTEVIETIYGMGYRLKTPPSQPTLTEPSSPQLPQADTLQGKATQERATRSPSVSLEELHPTLGTPPSQPLSLPSLAHLISRFQPHFVRQITLLSALVEHQPWLFSHPPDSPHWQMVRQEIHKLAGTLGTFGYTTGSELAKELEQILHQKTTLSEAQKSRVKDLLNQVKQVLALPSPSLPHTLPPSTSVEGKAKRVLIVDRDRAVLEALQAIAPTWQIHITIANSLAQVRQILTQETPDLVLLDLTFSPEAGTEPSNSLHLLQELVSQTPPLPVVVLSQHDSLEARVAVARIGGSRFLPRSATIEHIWQTLYEVLHQPQRHVRIMAVDDDPVLLTSVASLLKPWDLWLTPLSDPRRFWQVLTQVAPDLLILDLEMPTFSGIDLCQVVRQDPTWADLPILILTSHTDAETIQRVFAVGADDFVGKPVVGPELLTRILKYLGKTHPPSSLRGHPSEATPLTGGSRLLPGREVLPLSRSRPLEGSSRL